MVFAYDKDAQLQRVGVLVPQEPYQEIRIGDIKLSDTGEMVLSGTIRRETAETEMWVARMDGAGRISRSLCIQSDQAWLHGKNVGVLSAGDAYLAGYVDPDNNLLFDTSRRESAVVVARLNTDDDLDWLVTLGSISFIDTVFSVGWLRSLDVQGSSSLLLAWNIPHGYRGARAMLSEIDQRGDILRSQIIIGNYGEDSFFVSGTGEYPGGTILAGLDYGFIVEPLDLPVAMIMKLDDQLRIGGGCPYLEPVSIERGTLDATVIDCPVTLEATTLEESDRTIELVPDEDTYIEEVCPMP